MYSPRLVVASPRSMGTNGDGWRGERASKSSYCTEEYCSLSTSPSSMKDHFADTSVTTEMV